MQHELLVEPEVELTQVLKEQFLSELTLTLTKEIEAKLIIQLRPQIESELRQALEQEVTEQLQQEMRLTDHVEAEKKADVKQSNNPNNEIPIDLAILDMDIKQIVEAILFAADKPMTAKQIQAVYPEIERPKLIAIQTAVESIINDYATRSVELALLANGYRFQVQAKYAYWVSRLFEDKPPRYSRAMLETMAIIAYRQPVTRGDIEDIRGVGVSSNIVRTLLEREWIRVVAHKEVPGRPALYGATKQFLDYFNLSSFDQLPALEEVKESDFSLQSPLNNHQYDKKDKIK